MYVSHLRQKAFPFGEGVGLADGRGHCLPLWGRCRLCRRKRTLPSLSGKVSALPTEEDIAFPLWGRCRHCRRKRTLPSSLGKVSALPTEEVIAFPFGEGVGSADGRGLCDRKCPHSAELNESKNKKSSRPMQNMA